MNHIGSYIRHLRITNRMTQEELGEILGVKKAAVHKIEAQQYPNLTADKIRILSETFKVYPRMFLYVSEEEFLQKLFTISGKPRAYRLEDVEKEKILIQEMEKLIGVNVLHLLSGIVRLNDEGVKRLTVYVEDLHKIREYIQ